MQLLNHNVTDDYQWQTYKQLELMPLSLPNPYANNSLVFGLSRLWHGTVGRWLHESVSDSSLESIDSYKSIRTVAHLDRCWQRSSRANS